MTNEKTYNTFYNKGLKYFTQNQIIKAKAEFEKALKGDSKNEEYKIMYEIADYKMQDSDVYYYKKGLDELKSNNYNDALNLFEKALEIKYDNLYQEAYLVAQSKKINIMECSKNILLTLNCIDSIKADCILKSRENGKVWYNIDSFANDFEIQPHELIDILDKLVFPAKMKNKKGRKVEF